MPDKQYVSDFYREDARKHGLSPFTAVHDDVLREKETVLIGRFFEILAAARGDGGFRALDLGCGNGHMLSLLADSHPDFAFWGADLSQEMIALARSRRLENCVLEVADCGLLPYDDGFFDAVYTERCLINILDRDEKQRALAEIHRVLAPGGHYLMIEGFSDGLENNNRARRECGLSNLSAPRHNAYFDKDEFRQWAVGHFDVVAPETFDEVGGGAGLEVNFLSSHYFMSRVFHALVTKGEQVKNTEFVKFFSFLPPIGDYAPIQAFILKKP